MVKSALCSVAVNHFIHQTELRTLKAPSSQTHTPLWNNLGLQARVKYSQMLPGKHREVPIWTCFYSASYRGAWNQSLAAAHTSLACESLCLLEPKEIIGVFWSMKWKNEILSEMPPKPRAESSHNNGLTFEALLQYSWEEEWIIAAGFQKHCLKQQHTFKGYHKIENGTNDIS